MRKVLRGYAKDKDGNLILVGTMPVPHSKDKSSPRERTDKRHLVRQGATIFKREISGANAFRFEGISAQPASPDNSINRKAIESGARHAAATSLRGILG